MSATETISISPSSSPKIGSVQPSKPRGKGKRSRGSARAPKGFEFVTSDGTGKTSADTRQFIRSHVMRGKNTKKRLERFHIPNNGAATTTQQEKTPPSESSSQDKEAASGRRSPRVRNNYIIFPEESNVYRTALMPWAFPSPVYMPSELRMIQFPEVMNDKMRDLMFKFFVAIKETMYPVEWCFRPDVTANCWFQWLFQDTAYFNSVLFVTSSFQDIYVATRTPATIGPGTDLSSRLSSRTMYYFRRTIELLQKRLNDPVLSLEDVSIATVVSLAMVADACGDTEGARAHVTGLRQMVKMRGGVKGMMSNRHVMSKICRVDLGYSIKYGDKPEFYDDEMSWSPLIDRVIELESPVPPKALGNEIRTFVTSTLDKRLQNIFFDLHAFSSVAAGLAVSKSKLRPELFQEIMMSIQYRLLLLKYDTDPISEAIRIGLLAYQTSIFLQMHGTKLKYDFIADQLTNAIQNLPETSPVMRQLKLWLVFIGSIAILDSEEPWLVNLVKMFTLDLGWPEARERLWQVMWIAPIHDKAGKQVYDGARVAKDTVTLGLQRFWTEFLGSEGTCL